MLAVFLGDGTQLKLKPMSLEFKDNQGRRSIKVQIHESIREVKWNLKDKRWELPLVQVEKAKAKKSLAKVRKLKTK